MRANDTFGLVLALAGAVLVTTALGACGGDDGDDDAPAGPCTDAKSMCLTLHVPADFAGTPVKIIAGFYEELPPVGPPVGVAAIVEDPAITPDSPFEFKAEDMMTSGDYFVYVVLYNEGGGNFVPVSGIDYTAQTPTRVRVGSGPVNLGDMTALLYQE